MNHKRKFGCEYIKIDHFSVRTVCEKLNSTNIKSKKSNKIIKRIEINEILSTFSKKNRQIEIKKSEKIN